jgi:hypothetical protein
MAGQDDSYDPFAAEKYESPTLQAWAKQAAGKDVETLGGLAQMGLGIAQIPQKALQGSAEDVQHLGEAGYQPQAVGPAVDASMLALGSGLPFAEAGAFGSAGGRMATAMSAPVDIWSSEAKIGSLSPGQKVQAGPGGPVGTFKGVSPGGSILVDWKNAAAAPQKSSLFGKFASDVGSKFKSDVEQAKAGYQKAINPQDLSSIGKIDLSKDYGTDVFPNLGKFPKAVPFKPPEKALSQGYVTPAAHGTTLAESIWEPSAGGKLGQKGDALRLPYDELGVHFGTPEQAHNFTGITADSYNAPRTYPVVLQTGKSLEMPDMGNWHVHRIKEALKNLNYGTGWGVNEGEYRVADPMAHYGEFPKSEIGDLETIEEMRDYLHKKGYDSVNYINMVEGPGQRSYIMFKPSDTEKKFVSGVRSPFAEFDPAKKFRPDLAAGIAGTAGIGAAAMAPSESKAQEGKKETKKDGGTKQGPTISPGVAKFLVEFLKGNPDLAKELSTRMQAVINGNKIQGQQAPAGPQQPMQQPMPPPQGPVNGP